MKKETKLLGIVLCVAIFTILFAQFVLAENKFIDPVKDMFADWSEGNLSVNIAKYLFLVILGLLIFSILGVIPTVKDAHIFIKVILAALISFLATAYLTPSEIYAMIASYSAMGFVICAAIPFIILIFFSMELAKTGGAGGRLFAKLMWFAFIAFLVYKLIAGWADPENPLTGGMALAYLIAIVVALAYIFFLQKQLIKMWFKEEFDSVGLQLSRKTKLQKMKRDIESESMESEARPNREHI